MMMLYLHKRDSKLPGTPLRPDRRGIIWMKIANDCLRLKAIEPAKVINYTLKRISRLDRIEIADMLTEKYLPPDRNGDCVLEMPTHGKYRPKFIRNGEWQRSVAARAAKHLRAITLPAGKHTNDRVIARSFDRTVVHKEKIGDTAQPSEGFFIVDSDGLPGAVAAGRYNRKRILPHQQMLQRRAWKHDAKTRR